MLFVFLLVIILARCTYFPTGGKFSSVTLDRRNSSDRMLAGVEDERALELVDDTLCAPPCSSCELRSSNAFALKRQVNKFPHTHTTRTHTQNTQNTQTHNVLIHYAHAHAFRTQPMCTHATKHATRRGSTPTNIPIPVTLCPQKIAQRAETKAVLLHSLTFIEYIIRASLFENGKCAWN